MTDTPNTPENDDPEMPIVEHLIELRTRLLRIIYALGGVFLLLLPFRNRVYETFALPVLNNMLPGQTMLAYDGIDIFLTPIKVCLFLACLFTIPWILYQVWAFVAPGMYRHEKRLVRPSSSPPPSSFIPACFSPISSSCRYCSAFWRASSSRGWNTSRTSPST